jgi:hypothetical protein
MRPDKVVYVKLETIWLKYIIGETIFYKILFNSQSNFRLSDLFFYKSEVLR